MTKLEAELKEIIAKIGAAVEAFIVDVKQHALEAVHAHGSMNVAGVQAAHDAIHAKADALSAEVAPAVAAVAPPAPVAVADPVPAADVASPAADPTKVSAAPVDEAPAA